ncbi:hypothetical protein VP01_2422g1 [Puccinia sorghi]|uniref:Integrase catalytic domain-containing protein n=2 Tax=Puccinia sorghi TaxID=27349 RepID=A0A0L6V770_9BASI|nr:hypothetical protein VP01_2422g1 [Puccinia sorghi]
MGGWFWGLEPALEEDWEDESCSGGRFRGKPGRQSARGSGDCALGGLRSEADTGAVESGQCCREQKLAGNQRCGNSMGVGTGSCGGRGRVSLSGLQCAKSEYCGKQPDDKLKSSGLKPNLPLFKLSGSLYSTPLNHLALSSSIDFLKSLSTRPQVQLVVCLDLSESLRSKSDYQFMPDEDTSKPVAKTENQKPPTTTYSNAMDKVNSTVLKTSIEGIPLLTNDNYSLWRVRVVNLLDLVGLKEHIVGDSKVELPSEDNKLLKSILVAKLDSSVQTNIINSENADSAKAIWKSITAFFASTQSSNKARVFKSFLRAQYTPSDIPGFITSMKSFQARLLEVGWDLPADGLGHLVMDKFPASMDPIYDMITHSGKEISIDTVIDHLRLHADNQDTRASGSGTRADPITLFTDNSKKCKRGAHNTLAPHSESNCWMLHPELRPPYQSKTQKVETTVSSFHASLSRSPHCFILDSGCSAHMVSNPLLFHTLEHKDLGFVQTSSDSKTLQIKGIGSIRLSNEHGEIFLNYVLFIPHLVVNLISVRRLVLEEYNINFYKNSFEVIRDNEIKMTGNYVENLPTLEFENCKTSSHLSSAEFIHKSLGHVSYHRLRKKLGIPLKIIHDCESCAVAKVTRASYKSEHAAASKPFEEIHLDLIGPIWPASNSGHRYILTLVDSCTRFCAAIPIKAKSDVMTTLPFLFDVEAKRFGYHPTTIHSDRGSEFINSSLKEYCENHLIKQRTSDAYTPQQNGLAERFNRTILESMRTILEDSGVSKKYWNEIAALFKNRTLPLSYFYPIGNRVSALILPEKFFSKLEPKGELGILVGYNEELRSYRVLTDSGKILTTKNVQFLDYSPPTTKSSDWDLEICEKEDELIGTLTPETPVEIPSSPETSESEEEIANALIPVEEPITRTLRERTSQVKPFHQSTSDPCLFIHEDKHTHIFFHVDDLLVVGNVDAFEALFLNRFPNSTAHSPDTLLGMDVSMGTDHISLSQVKLINKGLEMLGMTECKPVKTPLSVGVQLKAASPEEKQEFTKLGINFRTYTGILNYLSCRTRPDLAPAVSILSSFNQDPGMTHWKEVLHCWKYLQGTKHLQLTLRPNKLDSSNSLQHYTDATWADDLETRLSRSGSICFWKECPMAWNSKKQRNITLSSTEAEMNALSDGVQENQWIKFLAEELWNESLQPSNFHVDNRGLIEKIEHFGSNSKTKHLDIKMKWLRDLKLKDEIRVTLVPSEDMVADTLTKASCEKSLTRLKDRCFLVHYSSS